MGPEHCVEQHNIDLFDMILRRTRRYRVVRQTPYRVVQHDIMLFEP